MPHPDPSTLYPLPHYVRLVYLKNCITNPNITIGDYTYYDDPAPIEFEKQAVLYHFDFIGDRLIIGKFCAIASGVKFIMNGANHATSGFSTYPFGIFGCGWEGAMEGVLGSPHKGDTVVGNDVWIGYGTTILPGITIGDGAIIAALSVVTKDIAPYEVVGGNPAKVIKKRFDEETIALLLALQWWEREPEWITQHLSLLYGCDLKALRSLL